MNVSLPVELREWVERRAQEGSYSSTSEFVRELIRNEKDRMRIREMLLEAADSPVAVRADAKYFDSLRELARAATDEVDEDTAADGTGIGASVPSAN